MGGGCNSCKLLPEEKLKIDSAIIPPFVIGEDSDPKTTNNVVIYGGSTKKEPNTNTTQIFGRFSTIDVSLNPPFSGVTIGGRQTELFVSKKQSKKANGGVKIMGDNSLIHVDLDSTDYSDLFLTGVIIAGYESHIWSKNSWSGAGKLDNSGGVQCGGVIILGRASTCSTLTPSCGLILGGSRIVPEINGNNGVVIIGTEKEKSDQYFDPQTGMPSTGGTRHTHNFRNSLGIFMRGVFQQADNDNLMVDGTCNSLIEGSDNTNLPTLLKGHFKFHNDFQLKDKDGQILIDTGKVKEMVTTINELKERVEKLETTSS